MLGTAVEFHGVRTLLVSGEGDGLKVARIVVVPPVTVTMSTSF